MSDPSCNLTQDGLQPSAKYELDEIIEKLNTNIDGLNKKIDDQQKHIEKLKHDK